MSENSIEPRKNNEKEESNHKSLITLIVMSLVFTSLSGYLIIQKNINVKKYFNLNKDRNAKIAKLNDKVSSNNVESEYLSILNSRTKDKNIINSNYQKQQKISYQNNNYQNDIYKLKNKILKSNGTINKK